MPAKALKDSGQKRAEAEVALDRDETSPFVIAAETTRMPMVFTNARETGDPIIFVNDSFLELTGYDRSELLAQNFGFLLADASNSGDLAELAVAFTGQNNEAEIRYRHKDGSTFCASIFVSPVCNEQSEVVQHFVSLIDTTKHELARRNAAMLIDELNHRVKNMLATVQSVVTQAVRNSSDVQMVREAIETRIAALSRSHDLLSREKWDGAELHDLVREALAPFRATEGQRERISIEGEHLRLSPRAALALGVAFNELATNAVKYGAFSNDVGTVSVTWTLKTRRGGRWLCLHWREIDGPAVSPPTRKGFGSRVIEQGLAHELEGKTNVEYLPEGIVCTIDVPAPHAMLDG